MWRVLVAISAAIGLGSAIAYAQIINPSGGGGGTPGGSNTQLQFNTNTTFGGISGVTSDSANVGFATSSQLLLYGFTVGDCVKIGANNALADFGTGCGGTGSPGGLTSQVQFNSNGNFAGISGATSDSLSIGFTTVTVNGNLTAGTAGFAGPVSGTTAQFQTYTGTNIVLSGTATITASTAQFSGLVTASTGNFAGFTVQGLTGCVQAGGGGQFTATGVNCASQTSTPSIAAGANITTSGTAANTTVAVVGSPSFTNVTASSNITGATAQITGFLTAGGASLAGLTIQTATFSGNLTGSTANFSGNLTAGTAQLTGLLTGANAVFQTVTVSNLTPTGPNCLQETGGVLQATNTGCATQTATPSIAAGANITTSGTAANTTVAVIASPVFTNVTASSNITGATAQFSGLLTGTNAQFQTITITNLTPAGPNCLQETGGVLQATNAACATPTTFSIAAGSNITTSGTATNVTVNVVATPSFTTLITTGNLTATTAQVSGWLTAPGVNVFTETIANNLTGSTANFSSNLTANIAQFAGFLSAGGASISGLTIQTETLSSNLTGTTANFSSNLTANIAQFAGFLSAGGASLSGLTIQTETLSSNLTGTTANFSSNLTANIAQFAGFMSAGGASLSGLSIQTATFTGNLTGTTANFSSFTGGAAFSATPTVGAANISFISPSVAQFGLSNTIGNGGWVNWGGESRLAADKGLNISNAGLTATGLSVNVLAGRTYSIDADLYVTFAVAATGGIAVSLSGTYGSTDTHYFGYVLDAGAATGANGTFESIRGATLATAKNTLVGNVVTSGTTAYVPLRGTVSVSAPGTLLIAASTVNTQTAANGVSLTRGSRIIVQDMP